MWLRAAGQVSPARSGAALQAQPRAGCSGARGAPLLVEANKKVTKKMQVVLTKAVPNLGAEGQLTSVRMGYFRNYLLPQGFARLADEGILAAIKAKREAEEAAARKARPAAAVASAVRRRSLRCINLRCSAAGLHSCAVAPAHPRLRRAGAG